jgi:hypothetical protein
MPYAWQRVARLSLVELEQVPKGRDWEKKVIGRLPRETINGLREWVIQAEEAPAGVDFDGE